MYTIPSKPNPDRFPPPVSCCPFTAEVEGYVVTMKYGDGEVYRGEGDTPQAACDDINKKLPEGCPHVHYDASENPAAGH